MTRRPEHLPCWVDDLSGHSRALYSHYFRPVLGYNPWLEKVSNG